MSTDTNNPNEHRAALDQTLTLLKAKDDTSKFVGLSLMRTLLDTHEDLRNDAKVTEQCWQTIPEGWIIKLLRVKPSQKYSDAEAQSMRDLAIAVLHSFASLLPPETLDSKDLGKLTLELAANIQYVTETTTETYFQTLTSFVSRSSGGIALLKLEGEGRSALLQACLKNELGLQTLEAAMISASTLGSQILNKELPALFGGTQAALWEGPENGFKALKLILGIISQIEFDRSANWIPLVMTMIRTRTFTHPNRYTLHTCAKILQRIVTKCPGFDPFFSHQATEDEKHPKPFSFAFISFVLVDIKATIPLLMEALASERYPKLALQLAADFDVLAAFLYYLLRTLDDDDDGSPVNSNKPTLDIPPDLLLKLRKDISETLGLTIEFFRDRWDASISGAAGLHANVRNAAVEKGRLSLTWENPFIKPSEDPIIIAGLGTLGIWLREDDNDQLRQEAAGLLDVMISLYKEGQRSRDAVLVALEGIVATEEGMEGFLEHDGPNLLLEDILDCLKDTERIASQRQFILSAVRVLLPVIESDQIPQSKERWLHLVPAIEKFAKGLEKPSKEQVVLFSGLGHLLAALLIKAPRKFRTGYRSNLENLIRLSDRMRGSATGLAKDDILGLEEAREGFIEARSFKD